MHIKVDTREKSEQLFDAFDILAYEKGFDYEKTTLQVGDVSCGNVVIERKEANDFVSSIMDGRLSSQAAKMCLNYEYKYVIIEGNPFRTNSKINENAIIGKMSSLAVKYNIRMLFVEYPQQFVYACYSIIKKHAEEGTFNPNEHDTLAYKNSEEDIVVSMLYQIKNLGLDKAKAIAEMYDYNLAVLTFSITKEDLLTIPGIGDVIADKIIKIFEAEKNLTQSHSIMNESELHSNLRSKAYEFLMKEKNCSTIEMEVNFHIKETKEKCRIDLVGYNEKEVFLVECETIINKEKITYLLNRNLIENFAKRKIFKIVFVPKIKNELIEFEKQKKLFFV